MRRLLGVDFNSTSLSASIIDAQFRVVKPVRSEDIPLPEKREDRENCIVEAFRKWKKEYSPHGITIGLPLQYFLYRIIDMPVMKRVDVGNALVFELEKYLPLPVDEYIYDFELLQPSNDKLNVLVLAIKKETVSEIVRYAEEAELTVLSIRCSAFGALCGFLEQSKEKDLKGLFVHVTDSSYEITGLERSRPVFFKNVARTADISYEIERLLESYPGFVYFLGSPVLSMIEKFKCRNVHVSVSHALALSEIKKPCMNLVFLPQEFFKGKKDYYPHLLGGLAAATVALFFLAGFIAYYKDWSTLRSIEKEILLLEEKASGVLKAQEKMNALQKDRMVLLDFQTKSNIPIKVLSALSTLLPQDAWLIKVSIDDKGRVEMEGFARKTSDVVVALENSTTFKNVIYASPIVTKNKEERFSIKMEVEAP